MVNSAIQIVDISKSSLAQKASDVHGSNAVMAEDYNISARRRIANQRGGNRLGRALGQS